LTSQYNRITHILQRRKGRQKLTTTEEQTIVQCILDLNLQGFVPWLCKVANMANKLLRMQGGELVGKYLAEKFATHFDELKMALIVKYVKAYFDLP
jgi:hypothetical protein